MADLRAGVLEAARIGLGGFTPKRQRNPLYRAPTKAGAAWTHLYGTCRAFNEWAENSADLALTGWAEREDDQTRNVAAVRECAERLLALIDSIEAEG